MNSDKKQQNNQANKKEQTFQHKNNLQANEDIPASKDGFRYDYNDSSDFKG